MWEAKIINRQKAPSWFGDKEIIQLNETQFKHWEKEGVVEGVYHFRYIKDYKKCKSCGRSQAHRTKIKFVKEKRIVMDYDEID